MIVSPIGVDAREAGRGSHVVLRSASSVIVRLRRATRMTVCASIALMCAVGCSGSEVSLPGTDSIPVPSSLAGTTVDEVLVADEGPESSESAVDERGDTIHDRDTVAEPPASVAPGAELHDADASHNRASFPLAVLDGTRHFTDSAGDPFLLQGEAAWALMAQLRREEVDAYLADRKAKGFNTLLVSLIEHKFADQAPANQNGDPPFVVPGDFSMPNEAYFAHADWVLRPRRGRGVSGASAACLPRISRYRRRVVRGDEAERCGQPLRVRKIRRQPIPELREHHLGERRRRQPRGSCIGGCHRRRDHRDEPICAADCAHPFELDSTRHLGRSGMA